MLPATAFAAHIGAVLLNLTISVAGLSVFGRYNDRLAGPGPDDVARASRVLAMLACVSMALTVVELAVEMLHGVGS